MKVSWASLPCLLPRITLRRSPALGGSSISQEYSAITAFHHQLGRPEFLHGEQLALINTQLEVFYSIIANQWDWSH